MADNLITEKMLDLTRVVKFKVVTSSRFHSYEDYDNTCLYLLADTKEIYKGRTCYTDCLLKVSVFPSNPTTGKLYYNTRTREVKYWDNVNSVWIPLFTPMADTLTDDTTDYDSCTVTGTAIKNYIDLKFEELYEHLGKTAGYNTVPIFNTYELAVEYAASNPLSRPGQCVTAPSKDGTRMVMYIIQTDKTLVEYPSMDDVKQLLTWKNS